MNGRTPVADLCFGVVVASLVVASCQTATTPAPSPYRVVFVKTSLPFWLQGPDPGGVVRSAGTPPDTADLMATIAEDPAIHLVQHVDHPSKPSWTELEIGFPNMDEAMAYRELLARGLTKFGIVAQIKIEGGG